MLEFVFPVAIILFGLTKTTEKMLDFRQHQRANGKETKLFL